MRIIHRAQQCPFSRGDGFEQTLQPAYFVETDDGQDRSSGDDQDRLERVRRDDHRQPAGNGQEGGDPHQGGRGDPQRPIHDLTEQQGSHI